MTEVTEEVCAGGVQGGEDCPKKERQKKKKGMGEVPKKRRDPGKEPGRGTSLKKNDITKR